MSLTEKYVSALAVGSGDGLSAGSPFTYAQMISNIAAGSGAGCRYNIKADGTYTRPGDDDIGSANGSTASPIVMRGYKTTPGDGYLGRVATGELITTNMPVVAYNNGILLTPNYSVIESINYAGTRSDYLIRLGERSAMIAIVVSNAAASDAGCILTREWGVIFESDFIITGSSSSRCCVLVLAANVRMDSCRCITSASGCNGINSDWHDAYYGCLIKGSGNGTGIYFDGSNRDTTIRNCTITGFQDAIKFNTSTDLPSWIAGNMFTDNSGYGVNLTTASNMVLIGPNRTRDNALGDTNNSSQNWAQAGRIIPLVTTDTGGAATDYTNPVSNNYSLIQTSPAKGMNIPKTSDLGAYGLPDPAGGGGAAVFNPLAQSIIRAA